MENLEKVRAFVCDLEAFMMLRDQHFQSMRSIIAESSLISKNLAEGPFAEAAKEVIEQNNLSLRQADLYFRACSVALDSLTGGMELRTLILKIKVALNFYTDCVARHEQELLRVKVGEAAEDDMSAMRVELASKELMALIPDDYSAAKDYVPSLIYKEQDA